MARSFAIVPAAGHSRRMGHPKLLLPWRGVTLLEYVLSIWQRSRVDETVVVIRGGDDELIEIATRLGVHTVIPEQDPEDMKTSVSLALKYLEQQLSPSQRDAWLLAPADLPGLSIDLIDHLLAAYDPEGPAVHLPTVEGRQGHPVLFPWSLAADVHALGETEGVNALLQRAIVRELTWHDDAILHDIDTADDYRRLGGETDG